MADETKNQQQGGQTNYGSQQSGQPGQGQQSGQPGQQKNVDPNKKNPSTGSTTGQKEDEDDQNRDRQRRAS
ncbi:MAG TPA: hypothetical protein VIH89_03880 [Candidatus Sulfotelmatobacter sp.]|jgi:hypothetical protein